MSKPKLKALLVDLSGTIHVGNEPTARAVKAVERLRQASFPLRFCSNTTKESRGALVSRLRSIGFDVDGSEVFTSLSAVHSLVTERKLRPLLLLSSSAMEDFEDIPTNEPNAVVVGLAPEKLDYQNLNAAFRLLKGETGGGQAVLIATHKATYFGDNDGKLSLGPGGFVTVLEQATGLEAEVVGKPSKSFFQISLDSLRDDGIEETDWSSVGMVGDDLRNDLGQGARELGLQRFLVKTGKYREGDDKTAEADGIAVYDSFADLVDAILD